jgi:predicted DNA-binding transcriptional regulator AlpA
MSKAADAKATVEPRLITHLDVAKLFGVSSRNIIRWMRSGDMPSPHSTLGSFYLFDRAMVEYRLKTGKWPAGTKFKGIPHGEGGVDG